MLTFRTKSKDELTLEELKLMIDNFSSESGRLETLKKYYLTKNIAIGAVTKKSQYTPNNKLYNGFARYITDVLTGYFVGQPIVYKALENGEKLVEYLTDIFEDNDEETENTELAKEQSIYGVSYEILYMDEESNPRFTNVSPNEMFVVYDDTIANKIVAAVRTFNVIMPDGKEIRRVYVYDKYKLHVYNYSDGEIKLEDEVQHYWGDVPVCIYKNNSDMIGDFEPVISLIDAYDKAQSNTLNDMDNFNDAYLKLRNLSGTKDSDIDSMRENRIILLDDEGEAEWLTKSVNDAWVENFKTRIQNDIHKFSFTPDLTDQNFAGNSSGVSLKYKLLGMEQIRATKERMFRKGLRRRIRLICNILKKTSTAEDYKSVGMVFNNTLPQNLLELSQIIGNLSPYLSEETLISLLYFVHDPLEEMEKKQQETQQKAEANYNMLMQAQQAQAGQMQTEETGNEQKPPTKKGEEQ